MRSIRNLLDGLKKIGYEMKVEGENIRCKYMRKIKAIAYLTIVKAVSYFNARHLDGLESYIQNNHPDLKSSIVDARAKMDALWTGGVNTDSRLVEFRAAVEKWSRLEIEALRIFAESRGSN